MASIYDFTPHTGYKELCVAARRGWNSLTDEQKAMTNPDGSSYYEFGYFEDASEAKGGAEYWTTDTGNAADDDPRNADGIGSKELLVASFGTNWNSTRALTIGGIEAAEEDAFPSYSVRRAFTSQIIINHIYARDDELIDNLQEALDRAEDNGVKTLVVQPTTLMSGTEYDSIVTEVNQNKSRFNKVVISRPLCDTTSDKKTVMKAVFNDTVKEAGMDASTAATQKETAFVYMGHGTSHANQVLYLQMQKIANDLGYDNVFIGTVEGKPESTSLENTIKKVQTAGYTKVILRPLMEAAGDHANNDMAGDWGDAFKEALGDDNVTTQIKGLGELEEVQKLVTDHTEEAMAELTKATASVKKISVGKKKAKVTIKKVSGATKYQIRYSTKKSMKGAKTISTTKTKVTVKKLKKGKKYYFQARSESKTLKNGVWSRVKASKKIK